MLARPSSFTGLVDYTYGAAAQDFSLSRIKNIKYNGGRFLSEFDYGYDAAGRITEWDQQVSTGPETGHFPRYDDANRLTQNNTMPFGAGNSRHSNWRFDRTGNRLNQQVETYNYASGSVAREEYGINGVDQVTTTISGGALHVHGAANEQAKVEQASRRDALTSPSTF